MARDSDFRTPGQLIAALLDERAWTQRVLAVVLGVEETGLSKIIAGTRSLNAPLAIALGEVFNIKPEVFLELQKSYDLAQARIVTRPDPSREVRAHLFERLPVSEMMRRGWVEAVDIRDVRGVEKSLTRFFGVESLPEIEVLPHAAKRTAVASPANPAQIAWLYRVRQIASEMIVSSYSPQAIKGGISELSDFLLAPEEARKVPRVLADCGVRFLIVETIPGANIDGVCFWLDDSSPVVAMSLRFDRIDNFWFVLRHELEHVRRLHGREAAMLDAELEGDRAGTGPSVTEEERLANEAAGEFCVPAKRIESFVARKAPIFRELDMLGLAKTLQVHPGIVAGQIQHKTGRYDLFRDHLVKIRHIIVPNAIVDGWGNVAPL